MSSEIENNVVHFCRSI